MTPTHCPPARLAALTAIVDLLTRIEWAADPDDALEMCGEFPVLIRALVEVLGDEGAKVGPTVETYMLPAGTVYGIRPEPAPVLTNCDSCLHDYGGPRRGCRLVDAGIGPLAWIRANMATTTDPKPDATGCPGWKAREPAPETAEDLRALVERTAKATMAAVSGALAVAEALETPESVAKRCGLVKDADGDWWDPQNGPWNILVAVKTSDGWSGRGQLYPTELDALRAYAASVGK